MKTVSGGNVFFHRPRRRVYLYVNYTGMLSCIAAVSGALTRAQGRRAGWNRVDAGRVKSSRAFQAFQPPAGDKLNRKEEVDGTHRC
jgi:hypothetical protein